MKLNFLTVIISVLLPGAIVINAVNTVGNDSKWFLFNEDLFYINPQNDFSSKAAQIFCIENDMVYMIEPTEYVGLGKLLTKYYEKIYPLWLIMEDTPIYKISENCTALEKNDVNTISCATRLGLICKTKIFGGSIQYRNGTLLEVGVNEINRLCNPLSHEYDELLEHCLIKFKRLLL
ncbi:hypothetical protein FF38_02135 [Lucilia cuprina]|uniref:C-type lectin domain-containing protein n=1 Tax=Lucilia cuprina TaxID=7375 RepID=A0A0L0C217_LUCCU|nr:hypothetical protein CVS40_8863 [Lucilia cuprina]KNC25459.1 hypothetical protein FF38_02135 [Lucilia cuprina]